MGAILKVFRVDAASVRSTLTEEPTSAGQVGGKNKSYTVEKPSREFETFDKTFDKVGNTSPLCRLPQLTSNRKLSTVHLSSPHSVQRELGRGFCFLTGVVNFAVALLFSGPFNGVCDISLLCTLTRRCSMLRN